MESKFKVGDKVVRCKDFGYVFGTEKGKVYVVDAVIPDAVIPDGAIRVCNTTKDKFSTQCSYYYDFYDRKAEYVGYTNDSAVPPDVVALGNEFVSTQDFVNSPKHYAFFDDVEAIEIIASSMSIDMFKGYCMGNSLKYRLRAGNKDKLEQDIAKADKYKELYEKHKHLSKEI